MDKLLIIDYDEIACSEQREVSVPYDHRNRLLDIGEILHHILAYGKMLGDLVAPKEVDLQVFVFNPV